MIYTAMTVADWMYRGSNFVLPISIVDEDGDSVVLEVTDSFYLRLYYNDIDDEADVLIEKEATTVDHSEGIVTFAFVPADTESLLPRAYDFVVHVKTSDDKIYPVIAAKLGIVPFNTPIEVV